MAGLYESRMLTGTVFSGLVYQTQELVGCLWWSTCFILVAACLSLHLPANQVVSASETTGH